MAAALGALVVTSSSATASNYSIVANGTPVTAITTAAGENAKLTFAGTAGNRVSLKVTGVTMSPKPSTGVLVSIQNPGGSTLVSPFAMGANGAFMEPVSTPTTGTYTITLDPASTYKGKATLALYTVPGDPTATAMVGGAGVPVAMPTPGQNGTVTFSGNAGDRVSLKLSSVTISGSATNSARVSVLNPNATTLVPNFNVGTSGGFTGPFTLPSTGTYTVKVDPRSYNAGSATVQLYSVPADQAGTITAGTPLAVTFAAGAPGQNATETFSGTAGQRISLNLSAVTIGSNIVAGTKVSILNPNASTLVAATDVGTSGKFIEPVTLPSTGTYTIKVDPQGANTGGITLGLSNPAADTTGTITAGGAGVVFTASNAGQNGSLTFTGSANQRISLKLSSVTLGSNPISGTQVSVIQPNGKTLGAVIPVGTNGAFLDTTTLPTAGTYTIKINPQGALTGSATVNLYTVTADTTATLPTNGTPTVSTNTTPGQNMKLTFAGTANQNVSLLITSVTIGSQPNAGTTVTILKPNGTTLTLLGVGTSGAYVDTTKLPTTGTYTVKIDPQSANTGSATFKLNTVPADTTTTVTLNGGATNATNTVPGQNAKVTFTGTAGDLDTITTGPSQCCTITIKVLKPDGTTLASAYFTADNALSLPTLPTTGTYTIQIDYYREATGTTPLELIG